MKAIKYIIILLLFSCNNDDTTYISQEIGLEERLVELYGTKEVLILPHSDAFDLINNDPLNKITTAKVKLGQLLFHETALAVEPEQDVGRGTYSCASCHHAKAGFQSGNIQGIGEGGTGFGIRGEGRINHMEYLFDQMDIQPIRSPTIINTSYQDVMLWNGQFGGTGTNAGTEANWTIYTPKETNLLGFEGLETQAIAGLEVHRLNVTEILLEMGYKELFDEAFSDVPIGDRYTRITAGLAIAAYERCVLANEAPFQKWLKGDIEAMGEDELEGAGLFFGKANCFSCHSGPALNNMEFYALGMKDLEGNGVFMEVDEITKKGRGGFTNNPLDNYKFKTPQLYNLADVAFFGHGGSFRSIKEVVAYKNLGVPENESVPAAFISEKFIPLQLNDKEIDLITLFLEKSLYDPNLDRYVPESLPSGYCFPNADEQSKIDLNCDEE